MFVVKRKENRKNSKAPPRNNFGKQFRKPSKLNRDICMKKVDINLGKIS